MKQYHVVMKASRRRKDYSPIVMSVVLVLVFWMDLSFSDRQHFIGSGYEDGWQIVFTTSPISGFISGLTTLTLVAGVIVLFISLFRMNWQGIILLIVMLGTLFVAFGSAFKQAGDYQDAAKVKDAQGNEYHLLLSHFLQGSHLVIGKVVRHTSFETAYQVLADDSWESNGLHVVRAKGVSDGSRVAITPAGLLVGLSGNYLFAAYNFNTKTRFNTVGPNLVGELSPFILLREGDTPNEKDFQDLLHLTGDDKPNSAVIKKDLTSPIPIVRELAARYLKVVKK
ncbi:MAG: hypothetical protein WCI55_13630 [Armatimonadota bacterium]